MNVSIHVKELKKLRKLAKAGAVAQVAALCFDRKGPHKKVLLITSRDTGRWIIPKGWLMPGVDDSKAALREAWEEAGVKRGDVSKEPLGTFEYLKMLDTGASVSVTASVYGVRVRKLCSKYPEVGQRKRMWVTPRKAAKLVQEPELKALLKSI